MNSPSYRLIRGGCGAPELGTFDWTFASDSKTVRGEPVEPLFLPMNALRPLSVSKRQGGRMERKSCFSKSQSFMRSALTMAATREAMLEQQWEPSTRGGQWDGGMGCGRCWWWPEPGRPTGFISPHGRLRDRHPDRQQSGADRLGPVLETGARTFTLAVAVLTLMALWRYGADYELRKSAFPAQILLESQAAFMWMSTLYVLATVTYFAALFSRSEFIGKTATALTWSATVMGLTGLLVRWRESYLLGADIGHIPVSNLYEVFILFALITALLYLFYEDRTAPALWAASPAGDQRRGRLSAVVHL
jgi:hypothetical protein